VLLRCDADVHTTTAAAAAAAAAVLLTVHNNCCCCGCCCAADVHTRFVERLQSLRCLVNVGLPHHDDCVGATP
jgi:hypothetical protein